MIGKQNIFGGNHVWMRPGNTRALIRKSSTRCSAKHLGQWPTSSTPLGKHQLHPHLPASLLSPLPTPSAPPSSFNLGQAGGWEEGPRPKRWLPEFSYRGGAPAPKPRSGLEWHLLMPSSPGSHWNFQQGASYHLQTISCNDFTQRFHATVPNILRIPRISSHQARCILSPHGRTMNSLQHRSNPNPM